jgi:hypothetical protein
VGRKKSIPNRQNLFSKPPKPQFQTVEASIPKRQKTLNSKTPKYIQFQIANASI